MYTLQTLLEKKKSEFGNLPYIFEKTEGQYQGKSYCRFVDDVYKFANYLQQQDLCGKKIALYSENSYAYMVSDIAIMGFVGISVCISKDWKFRELKNVVEKLGIDAILYSKAQKEYIDALKEAFPDVKCIPMELAAECTASPDRKKDLIDPNDCSKIIFSSGTTGMPKAVMLSQNNMFACFDNLCKRVPLNETDVNYLFLPLHHVYAGVCIFLYSIITGMKIYICSFLGQMMEEIKEVNPTILCAVPLIYERIYATCKQYNIAPTKIFGDNIRYLFCGGAWFDPEIRRFFKSYDITLLHSYGLSETSSIVCVEYPNSTDFTSVGTVFENMTVKIDNPNEDGVGEIIVKGDNVFKGYYKNPEATNRAFDDCGFFHTGDLGRLEGNLLYNYGRIKKVIVLSNGENVYPDEIISVLKTYPGVSGARVFEKDRKIFATIYYNKEIDAYKIIESVNEQLPKHSRIQEFELIKDSVGARMK